MAITVDVTNHTSRTNIYKQFVIDVMCETLTRAIPNVVTQKDVLMSIAVVSPEEIRKANKHLRDNDAQTDILSLGEYDSIEVVEQLPNESIILGELIVCYEVIEKSAKMDSVHFLHELSFVVSHGVLHVLGQEHSEAMFALQDDISNQMMKDHAVYS